MLVVVVEAAGGRRPGTQGIIEWKERQSFYIQAPPRLYLFQSIRDSRTITNTSLPQSDMRLVAVRSMDDMDSMDVVDV